MTDEQQSCITGASVTVGADNLRSDETLSVLSKAHNRYVLRYLYQVKRATLDEITDAVCGAQAAADDTIVTGDQRQEIHISLYHVTLPRLADVGYIEYDPASKTVTETDIPQSAVSVLDVSE